MEHDANPDMMTPAEKYRRALTQLSQHDRDMVRLEYRWKKNLKKWRKAATIAQSIARYYFARCRYLELCRVRDLEREKQRRINKALDALRARKFDEAMLAAESALSLDEKCIEGHRVKGHCMLARKRWEQAIEFYSRALLIDENHVDVRLGKLNTNLPHVIVLR